MQLAKEVRCIQISNIFGWLHVPLQAIKATLAAIKSCYPLPVAIRLCLLRKSCTGAFLNPSAPPGCRWLRSQASTSAKSHTTQRERVFLVRPGATNLSTGTSKIVKQRFSVFFLDKRYSWLWHELKLR